MIDEPIAEVRGIDIHAAQVVDGRDRRCVERLRLPAGYPPSGAPLPAGVAVELLWSRIQRMGPLDAHHARLIARALELVQPDVAERGGNGMATIVRGPSAQVIASVPALLVLAEDAEWWVQRAILDRPAIDPAVLDRLRHSRHSIIRALTAPQISLDEHLLACATSEHVFERTRAAEQGKLTPELMERLAGDPSEEVRQKIALRRDLAPRALARLLEHAVTPRIRLALTHSPALTPVARARLGIPEEGPPDSEARARSARSPALNPEQALAFARDESFLVRCALAANPDADATALEHLMDDPHSSVRLALASNPRLTQLALLATDTSSAVRRAVAARSDTPRDVLEILTRDSQTLVRAQASETLRRSGA